MMHEKRKTALKRILSCIMALILILGVGVPEMSEAASKKKITVSTQKDLDAALKSGKYTKIVIKTDASIKITLKKKYASLNVEITVKAPNCDLVSNGAFKSINVTDANTVTEKASGNNYTIKDNDLTFNISEKAKVDGIKIAGKEGRVSLVNEGTVKRVDVEGTAKVDIEQNGKVNRVYVNSETEITVTGDSDKTMNVTFKKGAEGATLTTEIPVNVNSYAQVNLELSETAKDSKITEKSEEGKVEVKNITSIDKDDETKEEKKEEKKEDKKDSEKKEDKTEKKETAVADESYYYVPSDYEILQSRLSTAALLTGDYRTVRLTSDITLSGDLIIPEDVVLDLNGFTLNAGDFTIPLKKDASIDVTQNSKLIANHIIPLIDKFDENVLRRSYIYQQSYVKIYPKGEAILGGVSITAGPEEYPSLVGAVIVLEAMSEINEHDSQLWAMTDAGFSVEGGSARVALDKEDFSQLSVVFDALDYYDRNVYIDKAALGVDSTDLYSSEWFSYSFYPNFRFKEQKLILNDITAIYTLRSDEWLDVYLGGRLRGKEDIEDAIANYGVIPPIDITSTEDGDQKYVTIKSNDGTGKILLEYLDIPNRYNLTLKDEVEVNTSDDEFRYALVLYVEGLLKSEVATSKGIGVRPSENGCIVLCVMDDGKLILNDGTEIYLADIPDDVREHWEGYVQFYIQNSNTELGNFDWIFPAVSTEFSRYKIMMKKDGVETEMIPDPVSGMLRPKDRASGKITKLTELMSVLDWSAWTALHYYENHIVERKHSYEGIYDTYPMLKDTFVVEKGSEIKVGKVIGNYDNEFESEFLNLSLEDKDGDKSTLKIGKDHYFVVSCDSSMNIPSLGYSYTEAGETPVVVPGALELEFDSENASFIAADDGASLRIGNMLIETPSRFGAEPEEDEYKTFPVYISPEKKRDGSVVYNIILSPEDKFFVVDDNGTKTAATLDDINSWLRVNNFVVPVSDENLTTDALCIKVGDGYAVYDESSHAYVAYQGDVSGDVIDVNNANDLSVVSAMIYDGKLEKKRINIVSGAAFALNGFCLGNNTMTVSEGSRLVLDASNDLIIDESGKIVAASGSAIELKNDATVYLMVTEDSAQIEVEEGAVICGTGKILLLGIPITDAVVNKTKALKVALEKYVGTGVKVEVFGEEDDESTESTE